MYTVGIIGTGFGSKVHLPAFQNHSGFEVKSIAGRNFEKANSIAQETGVYAVSDWKELLRDTSIDVIAVTTPPYLHYEMGKAVLEAGKHLLLEKPTTTIALEARELAWLAESKELTAMMCHEFRWQPERMQLAEMINEGKLGDIRELHVNQYYSFAANPDRVEFGWLWDSKFDGGILGAVGSHLVDMMRSITSYEFSSVQGQISTRVPQRKRGDEYVNVTADDGFSFTFEMNSGLHGIANVTTSLHTTPSSRFIVGGDLGTAYLDNSTLYFAESGEDFNPVSIDQKFDLDLQLADKDRRIPPFLKLLDQLSRSLDKKTSLTPSIIDGWRNQQVLDALRQSDATNSRIKISDYV